MAVLVALVGLACWPAVSSAEQLVLDTPGPFSAITLDSDLACQIQISGDLVPAFHPNTKGGIEPPGACGTFAAFTKGEAVAGRKQLFGPNLAQADGAAPEAEFTASEKPALTETEAGRYVFAIHATASEPEGPAGPPAEVAKLTETDVYVVGQDFLTTKITIENPNEGPLSGTLYHVGDCFLGDSDDGYGALNVPSAGSVACATTPEDVPAERLLAFTPGVAEGGVGAPHYVEDEWPNFWNDVDVKPIGEQLPDSVEATKRVDNGIGLSWPFEIKGAQTATVSFTTTIAPPSPPTSSTTAAACDVSGQVPITVSAGNGAKAVRYKVDGGPEETVETTPAGQATITLTPGQHTLEYWGEDLTEAQESPHHVLSVTVGAGAPTLTISSAEGRSSYEVGETAAVSIAAAGTDLTSNPTNLDEPISTTTPGTFALTRSATNPCGTTTASFTYTVLPHPALGKTVNVVPVSGKVLVALPATATASLAGPPLETAFASLSKGLHFIPLTEARQIPVGSTLETTAGIARITTATASVGKLQAGEFGAGIFKLLQSRKQKGLTELNIIDNHTARQECFTVGKKRAVVAKHLSSKVLGRLSSNAHGNFTTRGQYSAATVRGTVWNVSNQCDGTLTKVVRGKVSVRDFRRRKTITLFAGQSYLAKAP